MYVLIALRQARRDRQLISKRLLQDEEEEEEEEDSMETGSIPLSPEQVRLQREMLRFISVLCTVYMGKGRIPFLANHKYCVYVL